MPCECCNCQNPPPCQQAWDGSATEWGLTASASWAVNPCNCFITVNQNGYVSNPTRVSDQYGPADDNALQVTLKGAYYDIGIDCREAYSVSTNGVTTYNEIKQTVYGFVTGTSPYSGTFALTYNHVIVEYYSSGSLKKNRYTYRYCTAYVSLDCPPCEHSVSMDPSGVTLGSGSDQWSCSDTQYCMEYDEDGNASSCTDYPDSPQGGGSFNRTCPECEFP